MTGAGGWSLVPEGEGSWPQAWDAINPTTMAMTTPVPATRRNRASTASPRFLALRRKTETRSWCELGFSRLVERRRNRVVTSSCAGFDRDSQLAARVPKRSAGTKKAHSAAFTVTEVRPDQTKGVSETFAKATRTTRPTHTTYVIALRRRNSVHQSGPAWRTTPGRLRQKRTVWMRQAKQCLNGLLSEGPGSAGVAPV
jgi:hypothetical protein